MTNIPAEPSSPVTGRHPSGLAVGWEQLEWSGDAATAGPMSHRAQKKARGPYRAAVPVRIAAASVMLPAAVAAAAEDALMEITRFDAELATALPATDMDGDPGGEPAPLAAVLLRSESASSSQIENVTAGAKALALATVGERTGPNAQMVAANVTAMQAAAAMAGELSLDSVRAAHAALMAGQHRLTPGRFRTSPVWVGAGAPTPHTASFVPPHAERVPGAMKDLLAYCARTDAPVLPHAAIAHAQFETIHPFADGNGRTGRVLVHALLRAAGATRRMTVPVSAGLLTDTASYFEALTAYREGDPVPIVVRFTDAALTGVVHGRALAEELTGTCARWQGAVTARRDAAVWRVLPLLVRQPAITVRWVQDHAGVSQPAAQRAVDQLLEAGIVTPSSANRRNRVWIAEDVITALDDFAARLGRRA
ncbi:UNVERIFIED_CONTAM: Fic family protein [Kocuria sp. CPCC 205274]